MRRIADSPLDHLARSALEAFGITGDVRLEFVNYRENYVFRARAGDQDCALKLHRPGYRTDDEIISEAAVLESLITAGVRVTEPIRSPAGGHLVHVEVAGEPRQQATLQRWIPDCRAIGDSGRIFEGRERPDDNQLRRLGGLMARIHAHMEQYGTPALYTRPAWDAAGLSGDTALWGRASKLPSLDSTQRDLLRRAEEQLSEDLAALTRNRHSFGAIHADLTVENVLSDNDGLVLIDFDDSGEGWFLFDLATTFFFFSAHPESAAVLDALVAGYRKERELTAGDLAAWHPLLLARALSYLGWSVERPDSPTTVFHLTSLLPWVLTAAEQYLTTGTTPWNQPSIHESE